MKQSLFRTKPILGHQESEKHSEVKLKRDLNVWHLVALGIGAIIGTGVFVLIGTATVGNPHRPGAGPGIILSFLCSGLICALAGTALRNGVGRLHQKISVTENCKMRPVSSFSLS